MTIKLVSRKQRTVIITFIKDSTLILFFSVGNNSSPNPSQQENTMTSMFQTPAMQSLMQQMTSNPALFQNMMQSPYMHDMMERMLQNPELMASVS